MARNVQREKSEGRMQNLIKPVETGRPIDCGNHSSENSRDSKNLNFSCPRKGSEADRARAQPSSPVAQ